MLWKTAEGEELYYEVSGYGPPLLLIHGLGGSGRDWGLQLPALRQHFRTITIDLRGHGRSSRPACGYTIPGFAADTADFMTSLGFFPAQVMGISLGGMVALQMAVDFPEVVAGLVIVNSAPELPRGSWRQRWELGQRLLLTRLFGMERTAKVLARRLFPKEGQEPLRRGFEKRWSANDPRIYLQTLKGMSGWSLVDRLSAIAVPTLILAGREDFIPLEVKKSCAREIPGARLEIIEDSGHATPADQAEIFNRVVVGFLTGASLPPFDKKMEPPKTVPQKV